MSNRKATFAKRQRETDLKDQARAKEARRLERRSTPKVGKGPEIAWDLAVNPTTVVSDIVVQHAPVPKDDQATPDNAPDDPTAAPRR
jgi:hypothetical protein